MWRPNATMLLAALLVGCTAAPSDDTTTTSIVITTRPVETTTVPAETTIVPTETTRPAQLTECPEIPYEVGVFPSRVDADVRPAPADVLPDEFTSLPATRSELWFDADESVVMAFVRGALPPQEWPGDRGEVSIDGARGVAGPFDDGSWVVAWFEGAGERCDQYFMVFYPPVEPSDVEATIDSLDRVAG